MDIIREIIIKKENGIDCTEEESAEIKGYIKEYKLVEESAIVSTIQNLFPQEYGEALNEMKNINY